MSLYPLPTAKFLTDDELSRFLQAIAGRHHHNQTRDMALFSLLATTGLRPSEARSLRGSDMLLTGPDPCVRVVRLKKRKAVKECDEIPVPISVASALELHRYQACIDLDALVFPMTPRQTQRAFKHYAKAAGIHRRVWCYCLRHTAATRIYRSTRDIQAVQEILGHENADTTTIYAHVTRAMLRRHAIAMPAAI